ncbi:MAG: cysteine desulfurase NifS [Planctomycetota bacterium]
MSGPRVYLDHAATSPIRPAAREALERALGCANPASGHLEGRNAQRTLEEARERIASLVGAEPDEIVFTSGATEASNLAIRGFHGARGGRVLIVSTEFEHSATRRSCDRAAEDGAKVALLRPGPDGLIAPDSVPEGADCVTVIAGHNELGTLQDLDALAAAGSPAFVHFDAVQIAAHVDVRGVAWDALSISSHKLGGPVGIGCLAIRGGHRLRPLLVGGNQEGGTRPGTVPVALAAGFAAAAEEAARDRKGEAARLASLRDRLGRAMLGAIPGSRAIGCWHSHPGRALPQIAAIGIEGASGDEIVAALDDCGIACASASACQGDARSPSLDAIGVPESVALLRLSLGWNTTEEDVEEAIRRVPRAILRLRSMSPFERRRLPFSRRAAEEGLDLREPHWAAAEAVFEFWTEHGVLPGPRFLAKRLGARTTLDDLFPAGMATLARWLGLPVPTGGCRPPSP